MRRSHSRTLAVVLAVAAGGLAVLALRPAAGTSTGTLAARNPAVEVRTQVIRRTIHVIRHEPGARLPGSRRSLSVVVAGPGHGHARTGASGSRASGGVPRSVAVTTHASGARTGSAPASAGRPVATRTSGAHSGSSAGTSSRPVTRASGAGHGEGHDGGDGHGGGGDD